jgi:peptidoglycan hydrolase CwlO-like protein
MKSVKLLLVLAFVVFLAVAFIPGCEKAAAVKDKFITDTTATIDDYTAKVDELAKKAEALPSPAKEEAIAKIDLVKAKMDEGKAKLEELKGAEAAKWTLLMADLKTIVTDLGTLYNEAVTAVGGV